MIKQIFDDIIHFDKFPKNHYTRKVISNYKAYGNKYDFCKFYEILDYEQIAIANIFNNTLVISTIEDSIDEVFLDEIMTLLSMLKPQSIEMNLSLAQMLRFRLEGEYKPCERQLFSYEPKAFMELDEVDESPNLEEVFTILECGFPTLKGCYDLWLTDTSHRVRRGLSKVFMYKKSTTATIQYNIDGTILIGHVATTPENRGKHYARQLLFHIGTILTNKGNDVILFARAHRTSYYKEIGFLPTEKDIIFERIQLNEQKLF